MAGFLVILPRQCDHFVRISPLDTATWNWWSQKVAGGGLLSPGFACNRCPPLDVRDIEAVCSTVATMVPERKDPVTSEMRPNETDDYAAFLVRLLHTTEGRCTESSCSQRSLPAAERTRSRPSAARGPWFWTEKRLFIGAAGFNHQFEDMTLTDRAREIAIVPDNIWARFFYHLARETVQALREED
ncbi:MAG: hypothetical protein IPM55_16595 [Acidobacteria bacterium]|nr:hypothetical protein [Acidobacteriota bacterium]